MNNIIVTGINGQDGYFLSKLLYKKTNIIGISNHSNFFYKKTFNKIKYIKADITDFLSIKTIIKSYKPSLFFNFAALTNEYSCFENPEKCIEINSMSILNILSCLEKYSKKCKFLNAGSCEEFGDNNLAIINEATPLLGTRPYAVSKIVSRKIINNFVQNKNMFCVQPWLFSHESFLRKDSFFFKKIINFAKNFKDNESVLEVGNILEKRDWLHCEDVVSALYKILNSKYPEDYVIGSGNLHSFKELFQFALSLKNIKGKWVGEGENLKFITNTGHIALFISKDLYSLGRRKFDLKADTTKLNNNTKWKPRIDFYNIVKKCMFEKY